MAMVRMVRVILTILLVQLRGLVVFDECVSLLYRGSMTVAVTSARLAAVIMRVIMIVTVVVRMLLSAHYNARNSFI